jgi:hypothetical protein
MVGKKNYVFWAKINNLLSLFNNFSIFFSFFGSSLKYFFFTNFNLFCLRRNTQDDVRGPGRRAVVADKGHLLFIFLLPFLQLVYKIKGFKKIVEKMAETNSLWKKY